ncbi:hypothetical protein [Bradyrhizobium sp.]|uniref:hypothetical protein n=1 Tax=Bradyrhizobium sp. TaxID=376 RepID=UPI0039E4285F
MTPRSPMSTAPRHPTAPKTGSEKERDAQNMEIENAGDPEDTGRDLVHGDGGAIDLPTKPGDLSQDD